MNSRARVEIGDTALTLLEPKFMDSLNCRNLVKLEYYQIAPEKWLTLTVGSDPIGILSKWLEIFFDALNGSTLHGVK